MRIIRATYLKDYIIECLFEDGLLKLIDFSPELHTNPVCKAFLNLDAFKKFEIEKGNIVWGQNWDMVFTPESLYNYQAGQTLSRIPA